MVSTVSLKLQDRIGIACQLMAAMVALVGLAIVTAAAMQFQPLLMPFPGDVPVRPNAGLACVLAGFSLLAYNFGKTKLWHALARAAGCGVLVIAALTLVLWMVGAADPIEKVFPNWQARDVATEQGKMAANAALGFLLLGLGLVTLDVRRIPGAFPQFCGLAAAYIAVFSALGYSYGISSWTAIVGNRPIAFPISVALIVSAVSLVLSRPKHGPARVFVSSGLGGVMARRLLPVTLALPLLGFLTGPTKWVMEDVMYLTLLIALGTPIFVWIVSIFIDDMDRVRTEALAAAVVARNEAIEANKRKSQILATVSHEVRTPLAGVIGLAEVLTQDDLPSDSKETAKLLFIASKQMLDVVNDVLDYSKLEAGKVEIVKSVVNIDVLAESVLASVSGEAEKKGIVLSYYRNDDVPLTVIGDELRLRQVLLNFAHNAVKFTGEGKVSLLVENRAEETSSTLALKFSVIDTGIGIAEENIPRLFNPFVQAEKSISQKYGGTGLGLAISKSFVELMGGEIGIDSKLGAGSTFFFIANFEKVV